MESGTIPSSIILYDTEAAYQHPDLDLDYIDELGKDLAEILAEGNPAEAAYQPGDGTRYGLVIVPLESLRAGRGRKVGETRWERHAVAGMKIRPGATPEAPVSYYDPGGFLVCLSEGACYPVMLNRQNDRIRLVLAASYVTEHWKLPPASGVSVAILLRAISFYLDTRYAGRVVAHPAPPS